MSKNSGERAADFIIIGAGVAGLTSALSLIKAGYTVVVLEQAAGLEQVGAGLQISPNGTRVLQALGLEEKLASVCVAPESIDVRTLETGALVFRTLVGGEATKLYGAASYQVHRADLIDVLYQALPLGLIRFGTRCREIEQDDRRATVTLESGEKLEAHGVIGADGIHSATRDRLFGKEETKFSNISAWRGLIRADRLASIKLEPRCHVWYGTGRAVTSYWVRPGQLYNFVGTVPASEIKQESWTQDGNIAELRQSFQDAEPTLRTMVNAIDRAFVTGIYYRDPAERWTKGRVTLVGDAAHAMVPFIAQGACQGMEDAWTLAHCISSHGIASVPAAFAEYEKRRRPRTTRMQATSRARIKLAHEDDPVQIRARDGQRKGISRIDPVGETTWSWIYKYNVLQAVLRPANEAQGLSATFEGKTMRRQESQRAFDYFKAMFTPEDVSRGYRAMRAAYDRFFADTFSLGSDDFVRKENADGVPGYWVAPPNVSASRFLLHMHGGGYVVGSARASLEHASRLARAVDARCLTIDYRLAPEHPYPAAFEDACAAYRWLLRNGAEPSDILLSGESAGAGLALALALMLKDKGEALPAGIIAISPFSDLTVRGDTITLAAGHDPAADRDTLTYFAGGYFQSADPENPYISPVFGDFSQYPPVFMAASTGEALESDARRVAERIRSAGGDVTYRLVEDSVHAHTVFPFLPESVETMKLIGEFADRIYSRGLQLEHDPEKWKPVFEKHALGLDPRDHVQTKR